MDVGGKPLTPYIKTKAEKIQELGILECYIIEQKIQQKHRNRETQVKL